MPNEVSKPHSIRLARTALGMLDAQAGVLSADHPVAVLTDCIDNLEEQLETLRKALEWYADVTTWTQPTGWGGRIIDDEGPWLSDIGNRARVALESVSNPAKERP